MTTRQPLVFRIVAVLMLGLLVAGCSGVSDSLDTGGAAEREVPAADAGGGDDGLSMLVEEGSRNGVQGSSAKPAPARAALRPAMIRKGSLALTTKDVEKSRSEVGQTVDGLGGEITGEETMGDGKGRVLESRLEVRVPEDSFDEAMTQLAEIGTLENQTRSGEDVTTQMIDNEVRIRAQRASLRRVEVLLGRATDLNQIVAIEAELTRRQAELESLESRQAYLEDQTAMSTITVYLSRVRDDAGPGEEKDGFLAGFQAGWKALGEITVVGLTIAGALLPFLVLFALVGVPLGLAARRVMKRRTTTIQVDEVVGVPHAPGA